MASAFPDQIITPNDQKQVIAALESIIEIIKTMRVTFSCTSCEHYRNGFCDVYDDNVPESHVSKGCDKWSEPIPF